MPVTAAGYGAFNVTVDRQQLARLNSFMIGVSKDTNRALARAINKTIGVRAGGMRRDIAEEVIQDVNLTKRFIYKQKGKRSQRTFKISRATTQHPTGYIRTQGANVPLIEYSNQRGKRGKYAKRISVKVKKAKGRKTLKHAFIPVLKSGHRGIFFRAETGHKGAAISSAFTGQRVGRLPIYEAHGPRVPDILSNTDTMARVLRKAQKRMDKNLKHEVDYILMKRKH